MEERRKKILTTLKEKSSTKQDVFDLTTDYFEQLKDILSVICRDYREEIDPIDPRISLGFKSRSKYEAQFKFGGDTLVFHMHTNVFMFERSHPMWQTSYIKEDYLRSYCGVIHVYNFLSDSFKFNRVNDAGYLIARIFINKDNHFFVEGKKRLSFLYNHFESDILDRNKLLEVVEECIQFSLDFDMFTPNFERVKFVTLAQIQELSKNLKLRTDKRLGFEFSARDKKLDA